MVSNMSLLSWRAWGDSNGKRIVGIKRYERLFDTMRFVRSTMMQDAEISYRLVVVDDRIRVRWNAKLWMRDPALGLTTLVNGEPALAHLDRGSNGIGDEGAERLAAVLGQCQSLTHLTLDSNGIGAEGTRRLQAAACACEAAHARGRWCVAF